MEVCKHTHVLRSPTILARHNSNAGANKLVLCIPAFFINSGTESVAEATSFPKKKPSIIQNIKSE